MTCYELHDADVTTSPTPSPTPSPAPSPSPAAKPSPSESSGQRAAHADPDPRPLFSDAVATASEVIADVRRAQLEDPTPCEDMNVRTMLRHLVGVLDRITALGEGRDPFAVVESLADGDDWVGAWNSAARRAHTAWSSNDVLSRPMALPWVQGSGAEILSSYFSELTVHTWDLAVATGQQPKWAEQVVDAALGSSDFLPADDRLALFEEISTAMGLSSVAVPFAERVAIADDAPAIDRLVAWNGRDPQWRKPK